ncbi:hypothetical protein ACVIGA_003695 [Bradyrhizobium sp. USDA 3240]
MLNAVLNNRLALTILTRAAWFVIDTGQRIAALSGRLEGTEAYTVRSNLAWKLRTAGENLERLGERLEEHVDARATAAGINADDVLGPLIAERSTY